MKNSRLILFTYLILTLPGLSATELNLHEAYKSIDFLREKFNKFFLAGRYEEARLLLEYNGPSSNDPAQASRILNSLRSFLDEDPNRRASFEIINPFSTELSYQIRWGEGSWVTHKISAFGTTRHSNSLKRDGSSLYGQAQLRIKNFNSEEILTYNLKTYIIKKDSSEKIPANYFGKNESEKYVVYNKNQDSIYSGVLTLENTTNISVNFSYKWDIPGSQWKKFFLHPGQKWTWWWDYQTPSVKVSPNFLIKYDADLSSQNFPREYTLQRTKVLKSQRPHLNSGTQYMFKVSGSEIKTFLKSQP